MYKTKVKQTNKQTNIIFWIIYQFHLKVWISLYHQEHHFGLVYSSSCTYLSIHYLCLSIHCLHPLQPLSHYLSIHPSLLLTQITPTEIFLFQKGMDKKRDYLGILFNSAHILLLRNTGSEIYSNVSTVCLKVVGKGKFREVGLSQSEI